jgi:iron(III) transport system permease protein
MPVGDTAPARRPLALGMNAGHLLVWLVAAYLFATTLWPLLRLFAEALRSDDGRVLGILVDQWQGRATRRAFANTLEASLLATALSVVVGTVFAALVSLTDLRMKSLVVFAVLLPLLVPSQITALAWIGLVGPSSPILNALGIAPVAGTTSPLYSKWGIVLVMGIEHAGLVFLTVRAALVGLPRELVEAGRLAGAGGARLVGSILLPLALPAILGGAALSFVASIGNFGVPAFLGIPGRYPMMTTLIYQRLQGFGVSALAEVASLALLLTLLAALGLALRALVSRSVSSTVDRGAGAMQPLALGRWRPPVELAAWLAIFGVSLLPLAALLGSALIPASGVPLNSETVTLSNFTFVLTEYAAAGRAFANSLALALTAAVVSAGVALSLAYLAVFQRSRVARVLDLIADAPYAIPGTVLGIAMILVYLPPLPLFGVSIYNTFWILLIAYLARFLILALRPAVAAMEALDPAIDEAARVAGAGVARRLAAVILPSAAPALGAGAVLIFMQAFNELTVSALLWSSGWETVGVVIFFLQREGNSVAAAALAVFSLAVTLGIALAATLLARFLPKGVLPWHS